MSELFFNPLFILYFIGSFSLAGLVGPDPTEQRNRASIISAKSQVAAVCRAQALCLVEHYSVVDCTSFGSQSVDTLDPSNSDWTYSFGDTTTEYGRIIANGNLSGVDFTMTCSNEDTSTDFGNVECSDGTPTKQYCKEYGVE